MSSYLSSLYNTFSTKNTSNYIKSKELNISKYFNNNGNSLLQVEAGSHKQTKEQCLIFTPNSNNKDLVQYAPVLINFLDKCKKLRCPRVARVLETSDTGDDNGAATNDVVKSFRVVTEPLIPLVCVLDQLLCEGDTLLDQQQQHLTTVANSALQALLFLHSNNLSHYNLSLQSLYLNSQGTIVLFDISCVGRWDLRRGLVGDHGFNLIGVQSNFMKNNCVPPELANKQNYEVQSFEYDQLHSYDSWCYGMLLLELYSFGETSLDTSQKLARLPQKLQKATQRLIVQNYKARPRLNGLSKCPVFMTDDNGDNIVLSLTQMTDEVILLSDKIPFYEMCEGYLGLLDNKVQASVFDKLLVNKLSSCLSTIVQSVKADDSQIATDIKHLSTHTLPLFFKCLSLCENKHIESNADLLETWLGAKAQLLQNTIQHVLTINDRGVRYCLVQNLQSDSVQSMIDDKYKQSIYQPLCSALTDTHPVLRAQTLFLLQSFIPHLKADQISKLVRYLTKLGSDEDVEVRKLVTSVAANVCVHLEGLKSVQVDKFVLPVLLNLCSDTNISVKLDAIGSLDTISYGGEKSVLPLDTCLNKLIPILGGCLTNQSDDIDECTSKRLILKIIRRWLNTVESSLPAVSVTSTDTNNSNGLSQSITDLTINGGSKNTLTFTGVGSSSIYPAESRTTKTQSICSQNHSLSNSSLHSNKPLHKSGLVPNGVKLGEETAASSVLKLSLSDEEDTMGGGGWDDF